MVRALAFRHACVLRIADLETQVCPDMPNKCEQNWYRYCNTIFFSQHSCLKMIIISYYMFIPITLTSSSYVHQNKLCIFLLCIRLFATCITNRLSAKPLGFWASYLHSITWPIRNTKLIWLRSRWPSFYIVISHRCSSYHKHNTILLHKLSHCIWLYKQVAQTA